MNKKKNIIKRKKITTMLTAVLMALLSFCCTYLAFVGFWEADTADLMGEKYNSLISKEEYFCLTFFFFIIGIYITYMLVHYRGNLYNKIFRSYKIYGIINRHGAYPDFCMIVFKKRGEYYAQREWYSGGNTFKSIIKLKSKDLVGMRKINEYNIRGFEKTKTFIDADCLYAFQYSEKSIRLASKDELQNFLSTFETNNSFVQKKIKEFLES